MSPLENMVYLVRCAVDGLEPDPKRVEAMDLDRVYHETERHMLASACDIALKSVNVTHEGFREARGKAIRKAATMDLERKRLFRLLDTAGIWYMPLKGCVLQDLYPSYGMRQMSDNDILFDASRAKEVKVIMVSMGFAVEHFGAGVHDVYHKEPVCNFELHKELFGVLDKRNLYEYYRDAERLLVDDDDGTMCKHLIDEDLYIYMLAHEYKHFSSAGTGLRSLLDTYVFLRKKGDVLDWGYVEGELKKLNLESFEVRNRELAMHLFGGKKLTAADQRMLSYIAESGTYGISIHKAANGVNQRGRLGYLLRRAFLPYSGMILRYPILRRIPVLLPACWVARMGKAIADKPKAVLHEFGQILNV